MILSFVPRRGCHPKWPGKGSGTYPYIGRSFVADALERNPASAVPAQVLSHGADGKLTTEAQRLVHDFCKRDGDLLPFDAETAAFCGVEFTPVERGSDGEWGHVLASSLAAIEANAKKANK